MKRQKNSDSRRNFIKKGITGIAGAAILPSILAGSQDTQNKIGEPPQKYKMIYRTLGKTGIKLPIISMGVMNSDNPRLVEAALEAGIVHIDTAWVYQGGRNEEMIGGVIKNRPRDSYVIATKIFENRDRTTGLFPADAKADGFIEKFETSLKRLGLNYVDILYLHNISRVESLMFAPFLEAMGNLKKAGKIRFIGVSTHKNEAEIIKAAADSNAYDVVLTAYSFRQLYHEEVRKAAAYAAGKGLGIVGMKAIAGRDDYPGGRKPASNAKTALKWALRDENFHTNIAGFTTFDQLYDALSIMEHLELTDAEKEALELDKKVVGLFCQQCDKCLGQCGKGIPIPDLMRSYMYVYGYRNLCAAKETLADVNLNDIPCRDCAVCSVKCTVGFDVKKKILDVARIKDVPQDFLV